jgi:hypothetical protein
MRNSDRRRGWRSAHWRRLLLVLGTGLSASVAAGPPYISDDPEPTENGHYEIYFFDSGAGGMSGSEHAYGIDFNYGGGENLQLTATFPIASTRIPGEPRLSSGLANVALAAKYRFLHQESFGWDVAIFPRLFLPSATNGVGDRHASFLLPIWLQKDFANGWSTFGGGGCEWNRGGDSKNFCLAGWAVTKQLLPTLQLGVELAHQTADTRGGHDSTSAGVGVKFDVNDRWHLLAYAGPGFEHIESNAHYDWYTSLLLTF